MLEVKAGQWWTEKGHFGRQYIVVVLVVSRAGKVVYEFHDGTVLTNSKEFFFDNKEYLPKCTGFGWEPEPKIRTIKVHTVLYGISQQLGRNVMNVLDAELTGFKRDWKFVQVLKTEEYEVPCE